MNKTLIYIAVMICGMALGVGIVSFFKKEETINTPQQTLWTCSMHTEVIQEEPGTCNVCDMQLIPLEQESSKSVNLEKNQVEPALAAF